MSTDESKRLDELIKSVKEIHDVFYKEPGIVHEVKELGEWKDSVNTIFMRVLVLAIGLFLTSAVAAIFFYVKNSP